MHSTNQRMKLPLTLYLYLGIGLIMSACADEPKINTSELTGNWEVIEATRNGKKTETVVGAYFRFEGGDTLTTNILNGEVVTGKYTLDDYKIRHSTNTHGEMLYTAALDGEANQLQLRTRISEFNFNFLLKPTSEQ